VTNSAHCPPAVARPSQNGISMSLSREGVEAVRRCRIGYADGVFLVSASEYRYNMSSRLRSTRSNGLSFPELAQFTISRSCNNSFGYERLSGPAQNMHAIDAIDPIETSGGHAGARQLMAPSAFPAIAARSKRLRDSFG
jgi:hypothetical protein